MVLILTPVMLMVFLLHMVVVHVNMFGHTYAGGLTSDNVPYPFYCCPCNSDNTVAPGYKPNPNQVYPDEDTSLDIIELYI